MGNHVLLSVGKQKVCKVYFDRLFTASELWMLIYRQMFLLLPNMYSSKEENDYEFLYLLLGLFCFILFCFGCGKMHFVAVVSAKDNINPIAKLDQMFGLVLIPL